MTLPSDFNDWLDQQLRDVRVPRRLRPRLEQIAALDDAALDAELRRVPVPQGMAARLGQISGGDVREPAAWSNSQLDEALGNVPVPAGLHSRLAALVDEPQPVAASSWSEAWQRSRREVGRLALAASLLLATGLWLFGLLASLLWASYPQDHPRPSLAAVELEPASSLSDSRNSELLVVHLPDEPLQAQPITGITRRLLTEWLVPADPLVTADRSRAVASHHELAGGVAEPDVLNGDVLLAAVNNFRADGTADIGRRYLQSVDRPRGIRVEGGQAQEFQVRGGVFVPVRPRFHPSMDVPLAVDSGSFELARGWLADGLLPPPDKIHTEDFLAALDYQFPEPAAGRVHLLAAGATAPSGSALLQIGVQARQLPQPTRRPGRLIVVVDLSQSMTQANRLGMVRRGLEQLVDAMQPDDRLSLVAFSEEPWVLVEDAGPADRDDLLAALRWLQPRNSTNVGAALMAASAVSQRSNAADLAVQRVVLLTDGDGEMDAAARSRIEQLLGSSLWNRLRLDVVQVHGARSAAAETYWQHLAESGGGNWHQAATARGVGSALAEILTGRSQVAVPEARLTVRFNAQHVEGYRPVGYEPMDRPGMQPAETVIDLYSGQAASALFELQLQALADDDEIAVVELHWKRADGEPAVTRRRITRADFASSLGGSPGWLQAGVLAATTAEWLRGAAPRRGMEAGDLLSWARQINTPPAEAQAFDDLVDLLEQAARVNNVPPRGGAGRQRN